MKKFLFIAIIAAFTFIACNNNSEDNHAHDADGNHPKTEGTHKHEDGSVHTDHAADTATVQQEQFKVGQDSVAVEHDHSDPNHKH